MAYMGFSKLKSELSHEKGIKNPGALAASIGRRKYGAKKFNKAAATGHSLKGAKVNPKRKSAMKAFVKKHG